MMIRDEEITSRGVDVLVITAHPDDAELSCGGSIIKLTKEGRSVALVDCTRGEMGSRGTPEIRLTEAERASKVLGLTDRWNLDIPDGNIEVSSHNTVKIIEAIRHFQPTLLLIPPHFERHPDHENVHRLCRTAAFQSGLSKMETQRDGIAQKPHRPNRILCYMQSYDFTPDFYCDITDEIEAKAHAIQAYSSQFYSPQSETPQTEPETFVSRPEFMEYLHVRARYFGQKIGVMYAEAFYSIEPLGVDSLNVFL